MADPELIMYIRSNVERFGEEALRAQLLKDGVPEEKIGEAFAEASAPEIPPDTIPTLPLTGPPTAPGAPPRNKRKLAVFAMCAGACLLLMAIALSMQKQPDKGVEKIPHPHPGASAAAAAGDSVDDAIFHGHYGFIIKMPPGYLAYGSFQDPGKTLEVIYVYPEGTNPTHFIHEGLYGSLGILRIEAAPRRVPQGYVGIDTLKTWVTQKLDTDKAAYEIRSLLVQGMPAFIVNVEKPFKSAKAYVVGQKIRYTVTGGEENALFTDVLRSLLEVTPHDRPGG